NDGCPASKKNCLCSFIVVRILNTGRVDKEELVTDGQERFEHHRIIFGGGCHGHLYAHQRTSQAERYIDVLANCACREVPGLLHESSKQAATIQSSIATSCLFVTV